MQIKQGAQTDKKIDFFFFLHILFSINSRLHACLTLAYNSANGMLIFSVTCAEIIPSFICLLTRVEHLILHKKIKGRSIPWNSIEVLYLSNIYADITVMQCLILSVHCNLSIGARKGSGMCYSVAIFREKSFSSTDKNEVCLNKWLQLNVLIFSIGKSNMKDTIMSSVCCPKCKLESKLIHTRLW